MGVYLRRKKDKTNKIPTSAADSMGGRISQRGKDNKVIRSDAAAFIPKNKNIINTETRNIDEASFTRENIDRLENHLSREQFLQEGEMAANDTEMINRARAIERGEIEATEKDKAFLTHELRENDLMNEGMDYDEAHAQSCKEYGIKANEEKNTFYTKEADMALYNADLNRY